MGEPCKKRLNRSRCRLAGWLGWAKEICIRRGSRVPRGKGIFWGCPPRWKALGVFAAVYRKMAETIEMPFVRLTRVGPILDGSRLDESLRRGEGWQDGDAAINHSLTVWPLVSQDTPFVSRYFWLLYLGWCQRPQFSTI